jgi:hypothetical protein
LNDAKKNFKRFNKLKNEIKCLIPFEILEENRLNKALFFFSKMKLAHCKEAIRDFQSSDNHALLDKKFNRIFNRDLTSVSSPQTVA